MAANRYLKMNSGMAQDIELGDINPSRQLNETNSTEDFLTPLANGSCSLATGDKLSEEQERIGKKPSRVSPTKPNSSGRVRKLIRKSSGVCVLLMENSGDQVPKKVHTLMKRGSEGIERLLESSNRARREHSNEPRWVNREHRNSLDFEAPPPLLQRLESIPSPTLIPAEPLNANNNSELMEMENFGLDSLTTLPLIPNSRSILSTPSFTIPFHDRPNTSSSASMYIDNCSMSTTTGVFGGQEPPEGLKEAIALNYPDEVCRQLEHHADQFEFCEVLINRAFWHACAHGAEKSASVLMERYAADPKSIHKNVPCIQLAARRGNVALLNLILTKFPDLVSDAMPKDALVEIRVPEEVSYVLHRQSDASIPEYHQSQRRSSGSLVVGKKGRDRLRNMKRFSRRPTLDEDEGNTIKIEYTHLSTPLHQTTLINDVPMTKLLVETFKADIEARDYQNKTALMYAAEEGAVQALKYLLESDAKIDSRDKNGYTALMHAVKKGNRQCILLLVQKGSDIHLKDYNGLSLFEIAKDETVCVHLAKMLLNDSMAVKMPLHGLVKKGYTHCFQLMVDNTIHYKGDCWAFDLRTFQMDDNGALPDNEDKYKAKKSSLLDEISNCENMDFVDCLPLRILVSHWLTKYGIWYILLKFMLFILNMTALSYLFIYAANEPEPRLLFNFDNVLNRIQVVSLILVLIGWIMHVFFECCEVALRCKTRWDAYRTRYKEIEGRISFIQDTLYFLKSLPFGILDYLNCLHNIIDLGIILSLPLFLIFCFINSPIQWYFAAFLYFTRSLEIVKLLTVSPFGIYVHTIWTTLSGDLPKFLVIVALSLFTFSGTLFISLRAPTTDYQNQTLPITDRILLRQKNPTEYWWLLLTSIRYLIEQGSVVKVDYITIFNWFAVIVFFFMLGWILLILRVIFIAHVSNTYALSRNRAERYVTSYKLDFLLKMQQNSLFALFFDLKKTFYHPLLEISRKKMRRYFESDITYAHWNSTWVDRVEEALSSRRKRNLQYKDKQLFTMGLGVTDQLEAISGLNSFDGPGLEGTQRRASATPHPSMEVMHLLDQHHNNLKAEFSQILEESQQIMEQKQLMKHQENDQKMEQLMFMVMSLTREVQKLNHHLKTEDIPNMSDSD